jgi:hypothetical protein
VTGLQHKQCVVSRVIHLLDHAGSITKTGRGTTTYSLRIRDNQ